MSDNRGGRRRGLAPGRGGHRRIAFLGDRPELFTTTERLAGYRTGLEASGIAYDDALIRVGLDELAAHAAALDWSISPILRPRCSRPRTSSRSASCARCTSAACATSSATSGSTMSHCRIWWRLH